MLSNAKIFENFMNSSQMETYINSTHHTFSDVTIDDVTNDYITTQ